MCSALVRGSGAQAAGKEGARASLQVVQHSRGQKEPKQTGGDGAALEARPDCQAREALREVAGSKRLGGERARLPRPDWTPGGRCRQAARRSPTRQPAGPPPHQPPNLTKPNPASVHAPCCLPHACQACLSLPQQKRPGAAADAGRGGSACGRVGGGGGPKAAGRGRQQSGLC